MNMTPSAMTAETRSPQEKNAPNGNAANRSIRMDFKIERPDDRKLSTGFMFLRASLFALSALYFLYISYAYYSAWTEWWEKTDAIAALQDKISGHEKSMRNFRVTVGPRTEEVEVTPELKDVLAKLATNTSHAFRRMKTSEKEIVDGLLAASSGAGANLTYKNVLINFSSLAVTFSADCSDRGVFDRLPEELKKQKWVDTVFVENVRTGDSGASGSITVKMREDGIYE